MTNNFTSVTNVVPRFNRGIHVAWGFVFFRWFYMDPVIESRDDDVQWDDDVEWDDSYFSCCDHSVMSLLRPLRHTAT
jgi:hypothetical protein